MNPANYADGYTADTICRAMGMRGFVEPSGEPNILRVLLRPSFHPEVCLTLRQVSGGTALEIVALPEQLWLRRDIVQIPALRESLDLPTACFEEGVSLFHTANVASTVPRSYVFIDGMGVESCLSAQGGVQRFGAHVSGEPAVAALVSWIVDLAWSRCKTPRVRNGLSHAGLYLGHPYPLEDLPPDAPTARLAVLGVPEERNDYLATLRRLLAERKGRIEGDASGP